jgi:formylglycine-generating enzyme required for sulfatase activity
MKGTTMKTNSVLRLIFVTFVTASMLLTISYGQRRSGVRRTNAPPATSTAGVPRAGKVIKNRIGMGFVYVPAGSFMMGSDDEYYEGEKPVHKVTIREGFYMGKYEVTQAQWRQVMGSSPSHFKGDNLPVENVSWDDAQEFTRKLNAKNDGYVYRLPTEAEWEYACRAGTTGDYAGDLDSMAWYKKNSGGKTHPVGQKQPNAWGLYDMHGNVFEWCEDRHHVSYNRAPVDGSAWLNGGDEDRVLRGGSWSAVDSDLRSASRPKLAPGTRAFSGLGFRVVAVSRST